MNKVDVVILAGANADPDMVSSSEPISRAMVMVGDRPMIQWIIDALKQTSSVGRVAAVGNVSASGLDLIIEPGEDLVTNIRKGIDALGAQGHVLIVSSDVPLITPEGVEDFIRRASDLNADLAYPIISKNDCENKFPAFKRTYVKTADGTFTGGNIMLASTQFLADNWQNIQNAYSARKQVFKLARMIGMGVLLRVIAAQVIPSALRLSMLEEAVSRLLGAKLRVVISSYPEIGEDVDKASDLEEVRRILLSPGSV